MYEFKDVGVSIKEHHEGLLIVREQDIDDSYLQSLKDKRLHSSNHRAGEFHHVASIPAIIVVKWLREGFNVYREPAKAIVRRLKAEGFDDFMATNKRI